MKNSSIILGYCLFIGVIFGCAEDKSSKKDRQSQDQKKITDERGQQDHRDDDAERARYTSEAKDESEKPEQSMKLGYPKFCKLKKADHDLYNQCFTCEIKELPIPRCFQAEETFDPKKDCKYSSSQLSCKAEEGQFKFSFKKVLELRILETLPLATKKIENIINDRIKSDEDKTLALALLKFVNDHDKDIVLVDNPETTVEELISSLTKTSVKIKEDTAKQQAISQAALTAIEFYDEKRKLGKITPADGLKLLGKITKILPDSIAKLIEDINVEDFLVD